MPVGILRIRPLYIRKHKVSCLALNVKIFSAHHSLMKLYVLMFDLTFIVKVEHLSDTPRFWIRSLVIKVTQMKSCYSAEEKSSLLSI